MVNWTIERRHGISFADLEERQRDLTARVQEDPSHAFLLVSEPEPTYTYGRGSTEADLKIAAFLKGMGETLFPVSRGGRWTYHGPGQRLFYPITNVRSLGYSSKEVRQFMECFLAAILGVLNKNGLSSARYGEPFGIYVGPKKLVSFGLAFTRGISNHGAALYLRSQAAPFLKIDPCGVRGQEITSLEQEGLLSASDLICEEVENALLSSMGKAMLARTAASASVSSSMPPQL